MKRKYITQSLLIILEIFLIPGLITYFSNYWSTITDFNDCITRFLTFTTIYEFLVFLVNKNQLDSRKDSLLICKTIFKDSKIDRRYGCGSRGPCRCDPPYRWPDAI